MDEIEMQTRRFRESPDPMWAIEFAFAVDGARFDEWTEITGRHWGTPYGQAVETALASL
jgi:hypothetical protein